MISNLLLSVYTSKTVKTKKHGIWRSVPKRQCMGIIALGVMSGELHQLIVLVVMRALWRAFDDV